MAVSEANSLPLVLGAHRAVHASSRVAAGEECFHRALAIAREQSARSFELRAATSLARLWRDDGKRAAARDLLAPVYAWFAESYDTRGLQDAKALLEELR
jgi:predicted ATPase